MTCDLAGLLANAADELDRLKKLASKTGNQGMAEYYVFSLREVSKHCELVAKGEATTEEFGRHYLGQKEST
jgi:hypothetical protein